MDEITDYFGIDISKDVFDVVDATGTHYQFPNSPKGFREFIGLLDQSSHCVMESTAFYHVQLANALLAADMKVSVENPLAVKRFVQMHLSRIKTGKSDAKMICLYAQSANLRLWKGHTKNQVECLQIMSLIGNYTKQMTMFKNKLEAEQALGNPVLFMCSFSAKKHNKACRDLFDRMVARGKPRKGRSYGCLQQTVEAGLCDSTFGSALQ